MASQLIGHPFHPPSFLIGVSANSSSFGTFFFSEFAFFWEFYSYRRHLFCVSLLFGASAAVHLGSHKFRFNGRAMLLTLSFKWFDLIWCMGLRGVSPSEYNTHMIYKWKTALLICWKEWKKGLKLNGYSTVNKHKRAFRIN